MPDFPCPDRSPDPLGRARADCGVLRNIWWCAHHRAYCMLQVGRLQNRELKLFSPGADGRRRVKLPSLQLPYCQDCPHRLQQPEAPLPGLEARLAICGNCPRIDARGQAFECAGSPDVPTCPLDLWPDPSAQPSGGRICGSCG